MSTAIGMGAGGESAAATLARHACDLMAADLPEPVWTAAETCLVDTVGCILLGSRFPWSQIVRDHALASGASGNCSLPGLDLRGLHAEQAALIGGAYCHAFELDSLRKPGAGVHPGATVAAPALAVAQEVGASGPDLLRAIVAGCEVMFRIGDATLHSAESRGFHAPGITGVFGAAVAAGLLRGLDAPALANAMGVAGSLAGGLLAFAGSGEGGMVKRLHLGRAAQGGIMAADLAARGYEGPGAVLEGRYGVLEAFCPKSDPARLTASLGSVFEIERICIKRYACHVTAQAPIQFLRQAMGEHGFAASDIEAIELGVSSKILSHHASISPRDVAGAQYSVPFALATAACHDPDDPLSFARDNISDREVAALAGRIYLSPAEPGGGKWGADVTVRLRDGRSVTGRQETFRGCPEDPMSPDEVAGKFVRLAAASGVGKPATLLADLRGLREGGSLEALSRR
ncbi:MmgE/PrpD family protein [Faunimonas sp. B44]|uniref:MmgE/PrpD family protein n=1 Tax=Faunimonas sp. B44 TaxID=3461493 RepID=UPI0040448A4D